MYSCARARLLESTRALCKCVLHAHQICSIVIGEKMLLPPLLPPPPHPVVRHQVPIGQMGNYQEHLKKVNPLREVDETGGLRTQLFGNPYKLERPADKVN